MSRVNHWLTRWWWGPFRRPLEAAARRVQPRQQSIISGPLRGYRYAGGLAQMLGVYEFDVQQVMLENIRPGQIVYDVGANNGFISTLASHLVGKSGRVFAFEPLPANVSTLSALLTANDTTNCEVVPVAVSDMTTDLTLFVGNSHATASVQQNHGSGERITVSSVPLDAFATAHPLPDFVKIDVEGAEGLVLRGAETLLRRNPAPIWLIEVHSTESERDVRHILQQHHYSIQPIQSRRKRASEYPRHIVATKS